MSIHLTKYELFEQGYAQLGVHLGLIDAAAFMKFIRYKVYLDQISQGHNHCTALEITAEITKCSFSTAWRAIQYFHDGENREV